jgi:hypothetical protein
MKGLVPVFLLGQPGGLRRCSSWRCQASDHPERGSGAMRCAVAILWSIGATTASVKQVWSAYYYQVLSHPCPWCLFLPDYYGAPGSSSSPAWPSSSWKAWPSGWPTAPAAPSGPADPADQTHPAGRLADGHRPGRFHDPDRGPGHQLATAHRGLARRFALTRPPGDRSKSRRRTPGACANRLTSPSAF